MKIRTRLLLFLLPAIVLSNILIAGFMSHKWYQEIGESFRTNLRSALISCAHTIDPEKLSKEDAQTLDIQNLFRDIDDIKEKLHIKNLSIAPYEEGMLPITFAQKSTYIQPASDGWITGYAPIYSKKGKITHLIAMDVDTDFISIKLQKGLLLIITCTIAVIVLSTIILLLLAQRISSPVRKLRSAALDIAAGEYGSSIRVKGPKEIEGLSNTLSTMSECLHENINRLKETSLRREKMYGEYECAHILLHLMLHKPAKESESDAVSIRPVSIFSDEPKGILLDFPEQNPLKITLIEAKEQGFKGIYDLLTHYKIAKEKKIFPHLEVLFEPNTGHISFATRDLPSPIFWSYQKKEILQKRTLASGDFFFLYNQSLLDLFGSPEQIEARIHKVLKFFAEEGLETATKMLQKEITYVVRKKDFEEDIHLICFQVL